jgi:hypothetical protein
MLYQAATKTILEVIAPGMPVDEEKLRGLAALLGKTIKGEGPVERVALVFVGGTAAANEHLPMIKRFGIGCRAIDDGVESVVFEGTRVAVGDGKAPEGPLHPILREASWPHLETSVHRRLLSGPVNEGPWVTYGWDSPEAVTRFQPKDLGSRTIEEVEAEALVNLAKRNFAPQEIKQGALGLPGEYCSEAILLPDVMKACSRMLGAELIAVAIPKESRLMCVSADDLEMVQNLMSWSREMFDGAAGRRISPLPFLVSDGKVVGFASPQEDREPPAAKKPWYKFW